MAASLRPSPRHEAYLEAIAALVEARQTPTATAIAARLGVTKQAAHEALGAMVEKGELRYSPPRQASYKLPKVKPETDWAAIAQRNAERFASVPRCRACCGRPLLRGASDQCPWCNAQNGISSSSTSGDDEG